MMFNNLICSFSAVVSAGGTGTGVSTTDGVLATACSDWQLVVNPVKNPKAVTSKKLKENKYKESKNDFIKNVVFDRKVSKRKYAKKRQRKRITNVKVEGREGLLVTSC